MERIENEKKLGEEPAFPLDGELIDKIRGLNFNPLGMSKRFFAAIMAMHGILSSRNRDSILSLSEESADYIQIAYKLADKLLKQETNE